MNVCNKVHYMLYIYKQPPVDPRQDVDVRRKKIEALKVCLHLLLLRPRKSK